IAELFAQFSGTLAIEGHTDDRPIHTLQFPSNWELSGARAASVPRYLVADGIDLNLVHIAGYAHMREVASNDTPEGRTRNRRVEFVFEYDEEHAAKPSGAYNVDALNLDDSKLAADAADAPSETEKA